MPIALYHRQVLHLSQGKLADTERVQQTELTRSLSQEIQTFESNLTQQLLSERQILALGSALVCRPELLLVDELSLGLAPVVVEDLLRRLTEIRRELGITILLVEQSATVALAIADYGYVMESGRIVLDGSAERLRSHPDIQEFYLGRKGGDTGGPRRSYRDVKQYRRSRRWYG